MAVLISQIAAFFIFGIWKVDPQHPNPSMRWKHRRRMAYSCLFAAFLVIAVFLWEPQRFQGVESIFSAAFLFLGSTVGAYIGFASYENVKIQ